MSIGIIEILVIIAIVGIQIGILYLLFRILKALLK